MPPENIFVNTNSVPPVTPPVQSVAPVVPPVVPPVIPPKPKKGIPKIVIIAAVALIVITGIFFLIKSLSSGKTSVSSTITWWGLWEDSNSITPLINSYQAAHPGVKITYVKQSPQDYRERLTSALAKGTGPDIFTFHNSWVPMLKSNLDSIPSSIMNSADYAKAFYPIMASDFTASSGIVGIPLGYDALTLYINQDIFTASGKTPPTTWDDLRSLSRSLTIKDDNGIITQSGMALGRTENVDHWPEILGLLMIQNGVDLSKPIGKPAEDALTFFTVFSSTDGVWDASLPTSTQMFAAGKLAMYIAPSWRAFEIAQVNPTLKFKTVPIPQLPKDSPNQPDITYATYWAQGVSARSSAKTASWNFLKFLSTTDSLQSLYANQAKTRSFGEAYPRPDMAAILTNHPIIGSIISQAGGARSWYLASRTFDGPTGINSQLANYFGDAINAVTNRQKTATQALETVAQGVTQILSQYRLTTK